MSRREKLRADGRLPGKIRRRLVGRMTDIQRGWGHGCWARMPWEIRDARRLVEAGLCFAAVSKRGIIGRREIALGIDASALRAQYGAANIMRAA